MCGLDGFIEKNNQNSNLLSVSFVRTTGIQRAGQTVLKSKNIHLFEDWSVDQSVFAEDGAGEDYFGKPVSISGDYAIIGSNANTAYLYKKIDDQRMQ